MRQLVSAVTIAGLLSGGAAAQDAMTVSASEAPLAVSVAEAAPQVVLPANTEITLRMNQEITTRGDTWNEGDTFDMTVVTDVRLGSYVVIPRGSRGVGRITWLTSRGAFGKSGKMDVAIDYVEVGGRRIPVNGTYRQEGEGNTLATVGGVIVAGVFAGFITGRSGRIPQGRELTAHTTSDLPLALPAEAQASAATAPLRVSGSANSEPMPVTSIPSRTPNPSPSVSPASLAPQSGVRCTTC